MAKVEIIGPLKKMDRDYYFSMLDTIRSSSLKLEEELGEKSSGIKVVTLAIHSGATGFPTTRAAYAVADAERLLDARNLLSLVETFPEESIEITEASKKAKEAMREFVKSIEYLKKMSRRRKKVLSKEEKKETAEVLGGEFGD